MEKQIAVKSKYNSLDKILDFVKKESDYTCSQEYDSWDVRTDADGQMEKCILIKKSTMHGMKIHFTQDNTLMMSYIIPNKIMNAYFGENKETHKNILEIITGAIKNTLLIGSQKKAFEEMEDVVSKISTP